MHWRRNSTSNIWKRKYNGESVNVCVYCSEPWVKNMCTLMKKHNTFDGLISKARCDTIVKTHPELNPAFSACVYTNDSYPSVGVWPTSVSTVTLSLLAISSRSCFVRWRLSSLSCLRRKHSKMSFLSQPLPLAMIRDRLRFSFF